MRNIKFNKSHGFTLVEIMGAFAIIGIFVAFVLPIFMDQTRSAKVSQFRMSYTDMVNKINTFYSPEYDYTGLDVATVVDGKLGPSTALRGSGSAGTIQFSLGDTCEPAVSTARTDLFTITCSGFPKDACAEAIRLIDDVSIKISAGASAGSLTPLKDLTAATPTELNRSQLAQVCGGITGPVFSFQATHR